MSAPAINDDSQTVILLCNTLGQAGSMMCWFNGTPNAEDNQPPTSTGDIAIIGSPQAGPNGYVIWEGQQINGLFPDHLEFQTQIRGTGASQPINTVVGQGFHSPPFAAPPPGSPPYQFNVFNICRDNDRIVYTDPVLGQVQTIYYCTFANTTTSSVPPFVPIP